jgi:hypothetical protein
MAKTESQKPVSPFMAAEPTTMGPEVLAAIPDEYLAAMGRVSGAWAILDFQLDMAICGFAQMLQILGVAVTSQILSTPSKLNALGGLLRAHGMPESRIKWLDKFTQKTHGLGRKRNRAVHDAIMVGRKTGTVYRMTAILDVDKQVAFGVTPSSPDELKEIYKEINDHVAEFGRFWYGASAELDSLRQTTPIASFQIYPLPPQPESTPHLENQLQRRSSPGKERKRKRKKK